MKFNQYLHNHGKLQSTCHHASPQESYRTLKETSTSTKHLTGTELREQSAHSQTDINGLTGKESHLKNNKDICFG